MSFIGDINTIRKDLVSSAVSVLGTDIVKFALNVQTLDGISVDCKAEEADATDGPWTTITGGTFTQVTSAPSSEVLTLNLTKSLIRYVITLIGDEAEIHLIADDDVQNEFDNAIEIDNIPNLPGPLAAGTKGALDLVNTDSDGVGLRVYSNHGAGADAALAAFYVDNNAFDQPAVQILNDGDKEALKIRNRKTGANEVCLEIHHDGAGGGDAAIRIRDERPDIEFFNESEIPPVGQFEIGVSGDEFRFGGRNAPDTGFETTFAYKRVANGGVLIFPNAVQFLITGLEEGVADAPPVKPSKYLIIDDNTVTLAIPCYKIT